LTDIDILLSGGKKIACHRMLLAAASPYFKQALMFHEGARLTDLDLQAEADTDVMEAITAGGSTCPSICCTSFCELQTSFR